MADYLILEIPLFIKKVKSYLNDVSKSAVKSLSTTLEMLT